MGKQSTAIHRLCSEMEASKACQEECFFFYEKTRVREPHTVGFYVQSNYLIK